MLSDAGLKLFSAPFLGPCELRELDLTGQMGFCHGVAALAGGRFPGFVFTTTQAAGLCYKFWGISACHEDSLMPCSCG